MGLRFDRTIPLLQDLREYAPGRITHLANRLETARNVFAGERSLPKIQAQLAHIQRNRSRTSSQPRVTTWLPAIPLSGLKEQYQAPKFISDYLALASDGSQLVSDRQDPVTCFLLNISQIALRYGASPAAMLDSEPCIFFRPEELELCNPANANDRTPIEGSVLDVLRAVGEFEALADLAESYASDLPTLALFDGSLLLWAIGGKGYDSYVRAELLGKRLMRQLDRLRAVAQTRPLVLAGYISATASTNLIDTLRLAVCPYQPLDCDKHCAHKSPPDAPECDVVGGLLDRELLEDLLGPGERSALFESLSSIQEFYGEHRIQFFYLNVGREIARVEVPAWVTRDGGLVDLVHGAILDQCQRGQGYPAALIEAHEQAVVTARDREHFWLLVEQSLAREQGLASVAGKAFSKRVRGL